MGSHNKNPGMAKFKDVIIAHLVIDIQNQKYKNHSIRITTTASGNRRKSRKHKKLHTTPTLN